MKKIKKYICTILIVYIILSFILKLDFLFYKVKICNNSGADMNVTIMTRDRNFLLDIYNSYKDEFYRPPNKNISFGKIYDGECSNYRNMYRLDNTVSMKGYISKDDICYSLGGANEYNMVKEKYGSYIFNITLRHYSSNGLSCTLGANITRQ